MSTRPEIDALLDELVPDGEWIGAPPSVLLEQLFTKTADYAENLTTGLGGLPSNYILTSPTGTGPNLLSEAIAQALADPSPPSSSNPYLIELLPGLYTEPATVTIPQYVNVRGTRATIICSSNPGIIVGPDCTVDGVIVVGVGTNVGWTVNHGAAGSSNFTSCAAFSTALGFSISNGSTTVLTNCAQSTCTNGLLLDGAGTNTILTNYSGINTTGYNIKADNGASLNVKDSFINGTTYAVGKKAIVVDNASIARVSGTIIRNVETGLNILNGSTASAIGINVEHDTVTDHLNIDATSTASISGVIDISNQSTVDPSAKLIAIAIHNEFGGEPAIQVFGELNVGSETQPVESVFGGGDSHTRGMKVLTNTNLEVGTWADQTSAAASLTGSTFDFVPGPGVGNCMYVGADYKFPGLKIGVSGTGNFGTGIGLYEYWDGAAWQTFEIMVRDANDYSPFIRGNAIGLRVTDEQVRFGALDYSQWQKKTLNGVEKYWARLRIDQAIISSPQAEYIKLHTHRTEINSDGFIEFYGDARPTILADQVHRKLKEDAVGAAMANGAINYTANVQINSVDNRFAGNATDGFGGIFIIPQNMDTSDTVTMTMRLAQTSGTPASGSVFEFYWTKAQIGALVDGTDPDLVERNNLNPTGPVTVTPATLAATFDVSFTFTVEELIPGDEMAFVIKRPANTDANDTAGDIIITTLRCEYKAWRV